MLRRFLKTRGTVRCLSSTPGVLTMPAFDYEPPPYDGLSKDEVIATRNTNLAHAIQRQTFFRDPPLFVAGKRQYLFDDEGKRYLDLWGGICTVSAGHSHEGIQKAITKQLGVLQHTANIFLHSKVNEYARRILETIPEDSDLSCVYLCNSGSEANDLALMMARAYTGSLEVVGLKKSYHGASAGNLSLTTLPAYRRRSMPSFNVSHMMSPDPYRGIWGGSKCRDGPCQTLRTCECAEGSCNAAEMYAQQYRDHLYHLCPSGTGLAAFIAEGIGGMSSALMAPKGFFKKAYKITKEFGGVNIMDEVQSGFGRLGSHFWGFEYQGVRPDIITAAKSMGNGYPIAMVISTPEVSKAFADSGLHFNTFGGNALGSAAGLATLEALQEENLMENCDVVGTRFLNGLDTLRSKYDVIGDCRGKGLFISLELVESKRTHAPLPAYHLSALHERIKDHGIIIGRGGAYANCLRIQPPMCVTVADADFAVSVLDKVLHEYTNGEIDVESYNPNK